MNPKSKNVSVGFFIASVITFAMPSLADTLELRIVGDGDASVVPGGAAVNVFIQGRIQNPTDFGLALWSANLSDTGANGEDLSGVLLDSPGGDIDQFKKNLGLTNPSGYGGTPITGNLIQIGGGQNTISNTGPTLFPVGTVATDVANGAAWVNLAVGTFDTTGVSGDFVLTLDTGFASTLATDSGPFFPVNPATVSIGGSLTLVACVCPPAELTQIASTGQHDTNRALGGAGYDIPIDPTDGADKSGLIESRQFASNGNLSVRVDFLEMVADGSVSSEPALGSLVATPNGNSLDITFDAPANGSCISFDLTGTQFASGVVLDESLGSSDADFCICYFEGDVNFDSQVNFIDRGVVALPNNFFLTVDNPGITGPQVDVNRDGIMDFLDRGVIALPANFFQDYTSVTCP